MVHVPDTTPPVVSDASNVIVADNALPFGQVSLLLGFVFSAVPEPVTVAAVVGVGGVTVVLPSGHVSTTAQDASACLCLASAVLSMVLLLDASEAEPELLLAVFLFGLTFVFII